MPKEATLHEDKYNDAQKQMKTSLATRLKKLRESKRLSHEKLAKQLKDKQNITISKQTLINYEISHVDDYTTKSTAGFGMNITYLWGIARFFGVTTDYLLGLKKAPIHEEEDICNRTGLSIEAVQKLLYVGAVHNKFTDAGGTSYDDQLQTLSFIIENGFGVTMPTNKEADVDGVIHPNRSKFLWEMYNYLFLKYHFKNDGRDADMYTEAFKEHIGKDDYELPVLGEELMLDESAIGISSSRIKNGFATIYSKDLNDMHLGKIIRALTDLKDTAETAEKEAPNGKHNPTNK